MNRACLVGAAAACVLGGPSVVGQVEEGRLSAELGYVTHLSVDIWGRTAVIGHPSKGRVLVFERLSGVWSQSVVLTDPEGIANSDFGASVAVEGDTLLVGATEYPGYPNFTYGAVYVFQRSGQQWTYTQRVSANQHRDEFFGANLDIDGERFCAGATRRAVVFGRANGIWAESAVLTSGDWKADSYVGAVVDLDGDQVIVGAYVNKYPNSPPGCALIFRLVQGQWQQEAALHSPDFSTTDIFGWGVALDQDTALVGAPHWGDQFTPRQGRVYAFSRLDDGWDQTAAFTGSLNSDDDRFGWSISLDRTTAVVTAQAEGDFAYDGAGMAYVFDRRERDWIERSYFRGNNADNLDGFGDHVAAYRDRALIASPWEDAGPYTSGAAYVFSGTGPPCYADTNDDDELELEDFALFELWFSQGDMAADCDGDGQLTLFDYLCLVNAFSAGC